MNPSEIQALLQQAIQLHQNAQLDAAAKIYLQILAAQPHQFDALHLLGVASLQSKQYEKAQALFESAMQVNPNHVHALNNYGNLLLEIGKKNEALASFKKATAINPQFFQAHFNLGNTLLEIGDYHGAVDAYQRCLQLDQQPDVHYNLGNAQKELRMFEQALISYQQAIALDPNYKEAINNCGVVLKELKRFDEAQASYNKALALDPLSAAAYCNLGILLSAKVQFMDAISHFNKAIELDTDYAQAYNNRGAAWQELMELDKAIVDYEKAISLMPSYADAHYNRAYALLLQKDFANGLEEHEWRKRLPSYLDFKPALEKPLWLGETSLEDKKILVFCEQGLGDTIQFSRFIEPLSKLAKQVIFAVPAPLLKLLKEPNSNVTLIDEKILPSDIDCYCPLLSLPYSLKLSAQDLESICPSLQLYANKLAHWNSVLSSNKNALKVGIAWSGNPNFKKDHLRSLTLSDFVQCLPGDGFDYISLQQVVRERDETFSKQCSNIQFLENQLIDFSDTAALIENLDLVLTTCTSIAHLAGSLGKPCWVLIPFSPDWKWFTESSSSPWYPSVRLFRQPKVGDWGSVLSAVKNELASLASSK